MNFVYWNKSPSISHDTWINISTLIGSFLGQILFGFLADKYGRKRLYGLELVIVIFSTIGVAQSSDGYNGSMSVLGWLIPWRFFMGLGIGAEQVPTFLSVKKHSLTIIQISTLCYYHRGMGRSR